MEEEQASAASNQESSQKRSTRHSERIRSSRQSSASNTSTSPNRFEDIPDEDDSLSSEPKKKHSKGRRGRDNDDDSSFDNEEESELVSSKRGRKPTKNFGRLAKRKSNISHSGKELLSSEESQNSQSESERERVDVDENAEECFICEDGGDLVCCDQCFRSYHCKCINVKKVPEDFWVCPVCENKSNICPCCSKEVLVQPNDKKQIIQEGIFYEPFLLRCSSCIRPMHIGCCQIPLKLLLECPINDVGILGSEDAKKIVSVLHKVADSKKGASLLIDYKSECMQEVYKEIRSALEPTVTKCLMYFCQECFENREADVFLESFDCKNEYSTEMELENQANPKPLGTAYFLTKFRGLSHLRAFWITEEWAHKKASTKLKNFIERGYSIEEIDNLETYRKVDRIVACKRPQKYSKMSFAEIYVKKYDKKSFAPPESPDAFCYLVKWQMKSYSEMTWESEFVLNSCPEKLKEFFVVKSKENNLNDIHKPEAENQFIYKALPVANSLLHLASKEQPNYIKGTLFSFQLEGIKWLFNRYRNKQNAILADEMGLGKTIQSLSFLNALYHEKNIEGPFLVVTPLTTVTNWVFEAKRWVPHMNVVTYTGDSDSRQYIQRYEFFFSSQKTMKRSKYQKPKFNVLVTSYQLAMDDFYILRKFHWETLIFDEAHRLKNEESKLYGFLTKLKVNYKLLLTGTPLQNTLQELMNLIKFIDAKKIEELSQSTLIQKILSSSKSQGLLSGNSQGSESKDEGTGNEEGASTEKASGGVGRLDPFHSLTMEEKGQVIGQLKKMLQPSMLRRTKADVDIQLPEVEELVVKLPLTSKQVYLYKQVLLNNYETLRKKKGGPCVSLTNTLMNLRLICAHPLLFLFRSNYFAEDIDDGKEKESKLVMMSNKVRFLDKFLPKIIEDTSSKVLIFSQFVLMLDVVGDYLDLRGVDYGRLDGQTNSQLRQKIIDNFNAEGSTQRLMIMSTRAGGLGINLTAANKILFLDSDFNPFNDLQAMARAHRIGQQRNVSIIRLVSSSSVEEKIYINSRRKMFFSNVITSQIRNKQNDISGKEEVKDILRYGAEALLSRLEDEEEENDAMRDEMISKAVEDLLIGGNDIKPPTPQATENDPNNPQPSKPKQVSLVQRIKGNELPGIGGGESAFLKELGLNKAVMVEEETKNEDEENDEEFWGRLLGEEEKQKRFMETEGLGKGKRIRKPPSGVFDQIKNANMFKNSHSHTQDDRGDDAGMGDHSDGSHSHSKRHRDHDMNERSAGTTSEMNEEEERKNNKKEELRKQIEEQELRKLTQAMSPLRRKAILDMVFSYGLDFGTVEEFWGKLCNHCDQFLFMSYKGIPSAKHQAYEYFVGLVYVLKSHEKIPPEIKNEWFFGLDINEVYIKLVSLTIMKTKYMKKFALRREEFSIESDFYPSKMVSQFKDEKGNILYSTPVWTNFDDYCLVYGIFEWGFGNWSKILGSEHIWERQINTPNGKKPLVHVLFGKIEKDPNYEEKIQRLKIGEEVGQYVRSWVSHQANNLMNLAYESS